jgi:protein subunit release factor A
LINTVDSAEEKLVKSARHAPIREKTLDTLSVQRQTRNKLVKQESLLQRHIKTVETFEELIKQIKQWLEEIKEKSSVIKEKPVPEEPEKINETLQEIEVRSGVGEDGGNKCLRPYSHFVPGFCPIVQRFHNILISVCRVW